MHSCFPWFVPADGTLLRSRYHEEILKGLLARSLPFDQYNFSTTNSSTNCKMSRYFLSVTVCQILAAPERYFYWKCSHAAELKSAFLESLLCLASTTFVMRKWVLFCCTLINSCIYTDLDIMCNVMHVRVCVWVCMCICMCMSTTHFMDFFQMVPQIFKSIFSVHIDTIFVMTPLTINRPAPLHPTCML